MSRRLAAVLATSLIVIVLCAGSAQATVIHPPLRVDGTVLRDQTGHRVGLDGVSVQMVPFYAGSTPTTQQPFLAEVTQRNFAQRDAEFAAIQSLGYDAIRVHIPGPDVYNSPLYESKSATLARIKSIVDSAKAKGLLTILDANAIGDNMADWRDYQPMFADLIATIGNDPWVIWEPFNEPADYSPGAPFYLAAVKGIGAYLRSLGSLQPMILPSDGYEQDVVPALMDNILGDAGRQGWRGAGLLFGVHPYLDQYVGPPGNLGDSFTGAAHDALEHKIADNLRAYPLIVTEMGRYNNGITTTNATLAAYRWVAGLGAAGLNGLIAWDWDWALSQTASDPNAWTWDGLHLDPWGQQSSQAVAKMTFPELAAKPSTTTMPASCQGAAPPGSPPTVVSRHVRPSVPKSSGAEPLKLGKVSVIRGTVRVVLRQPAGHARKLRLRFSERSRGRLVGVSRIFRILRGRRIIRWKLPRVLAGARFLTMQATYLASGHRRRAVTRGCWRALATRRILTRRA